MVATRSHITRSNSPINKYWYMSTQWLSVCIYICYHTYAMAANIALTRRGVNPNPNPPESQYPTRNKKRSSTCLVPRLRNKFSWRLGQTLPERGGCKKVKSRENKASSIGCNRIPMMGSWQPENKAVSYWLQ